MDGCGRESGEGAKARVPHELRLVQVHEGLKWDVLGVLAVPQEAMAHPALVRMVLECLGFYMAANEALVLAEGRGRGGEEEAALGDKMLMTQDSAVVQILLELLVPTIASTHPGPLQLRAAVFGCVHRVFLRRPLVLCQVPLCSVYADILYMHAYEHVHRCVHRVFLRRPLVLKLVHFQGYADCLIKAMVDGVPSMSLVRDWYHELVAQEGTRAGVFAALLGAHVAARWPMLHTEKMVRQALDRVLVFARADDRVALRRVLPVLPVMAGAFPRSGVDGAVPVALLVVQVCCVCVCVWVWK